jgi:hypothetical protein
MVKMQGIALAHPSGSLIDASHSAIPRFCCSVFFRAFFDMRATGAIIIGPEGGWDKDELESCNRHVSLGETVLRSETAGVAAAVLMAAATRSLSGRG